MPFPLRAGHPDGDRPVRFLVTDRADQGADPGVARGARSCRPDTLWPRPVRRRTGAEGRLVRARGRPRKSLPLRQSRCGRRLHRAPARRIKPPAQPDCLRHTNVVVHDGPECCALMLPWASIWPSIWNEFGLRIATAPCGVTVPPNHPRIAPFAIVSGSGTIFGGHSALVTLVVFDDSLDTPIYLPSNAVVEEGAFCQTSW